MVETVHSEAIQYQRPPQDIKWSNVNFTVGDKKILKGSINLSI
jgi:hypothetical protein